MVEFIATMTASGVCYIPKELREAFGRRMRIIPNASAALLFPDKADYEDVLASLKIIQADVEHRLRIQERGRTSTT